MAELLNKSKINSIRLSNEYYSNVKLDLAKIDFTSTKFDRYSLIIDKIIDCLIPYLLFKGYSTTSISDIAYRFIKKNNATTSASRIVGNFDGKVKTFVFLIKTDRDSEEFNEIKSYLTKKHRL